MCNSHTLCVRLGKSDTLTPRVLAGHSFPFSTEREEFCLPCEKYVKIGSQTRPHLLLSEAIQRFPIQHARSLETPSSFYNSQTKHNTKTKLTSIHFSRQVIEGSRSSWLQTLGNQLINCSPYSKYTNCKCYLLYHFTSNGRKQHACSG